MEIKNLFIFITLFSEPFGLMPSSKLSEYLSLLQVVPCGIILMDQDNNLTHPFLEATKWSSDTIWEVSPLVH